MYLQKIWGDELRRDPASVGRPVGASRQCRGGCSRDLRRADVRAQVEAGGLGQGGSVYSDVRRGAVREQRGGVGRGAAGAGRDSFWYASCVKVYISVLGQ